MPLVLDHTIVPSRDKAASAAFFSRIFGVSSTVTGGNFVSVKVSDTLTLAFYDAEKFDNHHYAFLVTNDEFDTILQRVKDEGLAYEDPFARGETPLNITPGGRGFYFSDLDGHVLELMTRT